MRLNTKTLGQYYLHFDSLDSTNNYLKDHFEALADGTLVIADRQYAGKGRRGRSWAVGTDEPLYMSFLLKGLQPQGVSVITLLLGLAVQRALVRLTGGDFGIKWPNDVVAAGKKLCGILCESVISGEVSVVCGVGINLAEDEAFFARAGLDHATSVLCASGAALEREAVAAAVLEEFEPLFLQLLADGFEPLRQAYEGACITVGKEVSVVYDSHTMAGTAVGIGADGSLICSVDGQLVPVVSGEASVRGLYGYL